MTELIAKHLDALREWLKNNTGWGRVEGKDPLILLATNSDEKWKELGETTNRLMTLLASHESVESEIVKVAKVILLHEGNRSHVEDAETRAALNRLELIVKESKTRAVESDEVLVASQNEVKRLNGEVDRQSKMIEDMGNENDEKISKIEYAKSLLQIKLDDAERLARLTQKGAKSFGDAYRKVAKMAEDQSLKGEEAINIEWLIGWCSAHAAMEDEK